MIFDFHCFCRLRHRLVGIKYAASDFSLQLPSVRAARMRAGLALLGIVVGIVLTSQIF